MSNIHFSEIEINLLRLHYLQEYNATLKKLQDVQTMLNKLGISATENTANIIEIKTVDKATKAIQKGLSTPKTLAPVAPEPEVKLVKAVKNTLPKTSAKKSIVKAAKKSKVKFSWRAIVENTLVSEKKFFRASDLYDLIASKHDVNPADKKKDMQSLQTALYQLSKIKGIVVGRKNGSANEYGLKSLA